LTVRCGRYHEESVRSDTRHGRRGFPEIGEFGSSTGRAGCLSNLSARHRDENSEGKQVGLDDETLVAVSAGRQVGEAFGG
jgi:hypothetical protein